MPRPSGQPGAAMLSETVESALRGATAGRRRPALLAAPLIAATAILAAVAMGGDDFEQAPIRYTATAPDNPVSRLQERLDAGTATLAWNEGTGWLAAVLAALDVPVSSQTLVFSKTSV